MFFVVGHQAYAKSIDIPYEYHKGKPIRILIVPGHDNEYSGAVFNGIKEADRTLQFAEQLQKELMLDPQLEVSVARDQAGYIPELQRYFENSEKIIKRFLETRKRQTERLVDNGTIEVGQQVTHNTAPSVVAYRLYSINKWVDEGRFDMVIHIHFNDDGMRKGTKAGKYNGFSIYVPQFGLMNASVGQTLGDTIGQSLLRIAYPSNLPLESEKASKFGTIPDFNLIALGSNRTLSAPSVLIEYAYIYEPVMKQSLFTQATSVLARATAQGVFNYIRETPLHNLVVGSHFDTNLTPSKIAQPDVLALQYAMKELQLYPPKGFTRDQCAFDGVYGKCTQAAVRLFQGSNNIAPDGKFGFQTRSVLHALYNTEQPE